MRLEYKWQQELKETGRIRTCRIWKWRTMNYNWVIFKQFVVTNCCKERPGSMLNKTLKNGILMLKYTSKESHFYADFKYISFIKFSPIHQKLRAWKNLSNSRKKEETPKSNKILIKITLSDLSYQRISL